MTGDNKGPAYAERIIARAKQLRESDAFAAPERQIGSMISAAQAKATTAMHGRNTARAIFAFVVAFVVVVLVSLCLPYHGVKVMGAKGGYFAPDVVINAYALWFKGSVLTIFDPTLAKQVEQEISQFNSIHGLDAFTLIVNRALVTFLVLLVGAMLALSGLLFQSTFRNPLAAPTMLGVSDGVTLGAIIFCLAGYASIGEAPLLYVGLVYGLGALAVVVVLLASRLLSGGRRYNVFDMLLLGTVICQLLGGVNQYVQYFVMDEDTWDSFYNIQQASDGLIEPMLQVMVVVVFVATFVVVFANRFKFNLVTFGDEEATLMGVRTGALRALALVVGSIMELAAIATVGQVAMLSMAVPFLVRYLMSADFRTQMLGNFLVGSLLLMVCLVVQHFFTIGFITIPLGTIVSVVVVPFFVWVVALSQGKWS